MNKFQIVIIDDEQAALNRYSGRLAKILGAIDGCAIACPKKEDLQREIAILETRRTSSRREGGNAGPSLFDRADVLVIDYDLTWVQGSLTGENVAYLARNYSTCRLILGLNQFGDNTFDLELAGRLDSFADLNIGGAQLDNPGLWSRAFKGYRPWHWPVIPEALKAFSARARDVRGHLNEPIFSHLGFPEETLPLLPKSILSFISKDLRPEKATFREFAAKSGNGLRAKDKPWNDDALARCAAARLTKWLEFYVLPRQDILVDAPHLASRYPSLVRGDQKKIDTWNRIAARDHRGLTDCLHSAAIAKGRFASPHWLYRPAWWWHAVNSSKKVSEIKSPWDAKVAPFVFCEDTSRFAKRGDATPFTASLDTPYASRYIENLDGVDYRPAARLAI